MKLVKWASIVKLTLITMVKFIKMIIIIANIC